MNIEQAKRIRDTLGTLSMLMVLFALSGGIFYILASILSFPVAFLLIIIISIALSTTTLIISKKYIEGKENND